MLNISFLAKYVTHFFYPSSKDINSISKLELVLTVIFHDHLYNIHYYWITYYILFLEFISQTSQLFKICNNKTMSVHEIVEFNLGSHNYIKFVLTTLINFIFGIYIWLLIPGFVACLIMQDNNFIFFLQLLIISFIYYKYIQIANNNYSKIETIESIFIYTWALILSTILNLIIIYAIQFLNKRPISALYPLYNFKTKIFLEVTGLFVFNGQYSRHLLCFFLMFIFSVGLHVEMQLKIKLKNILYQISVIKQEICPFSVIQELFSKEKKLIIK